MVEAPEIATARLVLRPHRRADFASICQLWSDERIYKDITGKPSTEEECWARLLRYKGLWPLLGFGYWAITDRPTGRYVGEAGLAHFQRGISAAFDACPEAGWMVSPEHWGQGLASEAMGAVLKWADHALNAPRTVCMIAPGNATSLRIAAKSGFTPAGDAVYKTEQSLLFERAVPALDQPDF